MIFEALPLFASLGEYERQADMLLAAHAIGDPVAVGFFHNHLPRFLDETVTWLPKSISATEVRQTKLEIDDARLAVARGYSYRDWAALAAHVEAVNQPGTSIRQFESAAEAVITGDEVTLRGMLEADPGLVQARSRRVTCHDPPTHRATLLHYLGANGIESYRQRSPQNAVAIGAILLEAGAEVDSLAEMYGGHCTTMSMLVSSTPPAEALVQVGLINLLLDHGAAIEGVGESQWKSPLVTALVFGFLEAAETLVARGASVGVVAAAGLGRVRDVVGLLPATGESERHRAFALAAQLGHAQVVRVLLDSGETPDQYNPEGFHSHGTALHHAALGGHHEVIRLLIERGARLDIKDTLWRGTPLGWALHAKRENVAQFLRANGARD